MIKDMIGLWTLFRSPSVHLFVWFKAPSEHGLRQQGLEGCEQLCEAGGDGTIGGQTFRGSYLAAGPVSWAREGRRALRYTRALWACLPALVPCLTVSLDELPCVVKVRPMLRDSASGDAAEGDTALPEVVLSGEDSLAEADSPTGVAGWGSCWFDTETWHALWHSAMVMKLLLLPWHPPYQKWTHLEVMTSKWYLEVQLLQEPAARGREQMDRSTAKTKIFLFSPL